MFTGREYDSETDLYSYRARMYSPALGRFLQPDPIGYADSMNLYQYCGNNPINWIDPWGLESKEQQKPEEKNWFDNLRDRFESWRRGKNRDRIYQKVKDPDLAIDYSGAQRSNSPWWFWDPDAEKLCKPKPGDYIRSSDKIHKDTFRHLMEKYPHLDPTRWIKKHGSRNGREYHWYENGDTPGVRYEFDEIKVNF